MKEAAFMARLRRGGPFLLNLMALIPKNKLRTKAALVVRKGEIELRICDGSTTFLTTLVLQASSTMFPLSAHNFALGFSASKLVRELFKYLREFNPNEFHGGLLEDKPLWIYKMFNSDEMCFLIGLNPNPLRLKPVFEAHSQLDPRELKLLPVKITLKSECFQKLLESFAPGPVEIFLFDDAVTWQQPSKKLEFNYRNSSECWSVGALEGRPRHLTVDFLQRRALIHASRVSKTAVIHTIADDALASWIMVLFPIDRKEFLVHLEPGLGRHDTATELKVSARSPEGLRRLMAPEAQLGRSN